MKLPMPLNAGVFALAAGAVALTPVTERKALVYCPVDIDASGCAVIAAALGGEFGGGVDLGYDGSNGTIDLATAELDGYAVVFVPSLAAGGGADPYARLRDATISARLAAAVTGTVAFWSGTPDQGSGSRAEKDALIRNLARFAAGGASAGAGLVALQDLSADAAQRYGWVRPITGIDLIADAAFHIYDSVRALTPAAALILDNGGTPLAYSNMASLGFQLPAGAAGVALDAVGNTGTSTGGQIVLLTGAATGASGPRIWTDKDDYAPGETVTISGSGFDAGESISIVLHEDPLVHADRTLTAIADETGSFVNTDFAPEEHHLGVRFVVTATGQSSGKTAQTTFTDGIPLAPGGLTITAPQSPNPVLAGGSASYTVSVAFTGNGQNCTVNLVATPSASPAWLTPPTFSFSPSSVTGNGQAGGSPRMSVLTVTVPAGTQPNNYGYTVGVSYPPGHGCQNVNQLPTVTGTVIVVAANTAPVLAPIGNQTIDELVELTFDASATDTDVPPNTLTFSLANGTSGSVPSGAAINAATGVFSWTPTEAQGAGSYTFDVCVADDGSPSLSDCETITVTVNEVNVAPVLDTIGDKSIDEMVELTFTAAATDADLPPNTLTFGLIGAPAGASINASTGVFSWTPTEAQGPDLYTFTVRVTDSGPGNLFDDEEITVEVEEVNRAPVLDAIGDQTIDELATLSFTATATDPDVPVNALTFVLVGAPAGATIDALTGAFSWTPTEAQGPGAFTFTVRVIDDGAPSLSDEESITVTVTEVNVAPVLDPVGDKSGVEGTAVTFNATATDTDLPPQMLTFSLIGAPAGASINGSTGAFAWTPLNDGSFTFTVRVTDDGPGSLTDDETITVSITNVPPVVGPITVLVNNVPNATPVVSLGTPISIRASFTDAGTGDTHTAVIDWGDGSSTPGTVSETAGNGMVTGQRTYAAAGVYRLLVAVNDGDATTASPEFEYVVVYDPSAGFVTGGGWIDSPAGACLFGTCGPSTIGKATFGFVSKYKKGANVPEGNTEFQFHAGNLSFKGTSMEWLVVAGSRAQYKGQGTINGQAGYGFMLSAIDGDIGAKKPDRFRIKVWRLADGSVVYDNQMGAEDDVDPAAILGGGSIVVHSK